MVDIFTYSSSIFSLIPFQVGTKSCSRLGGQAAWKPSDSNHASPITPIPQSGPAPEAPPEPTSFLFSPGDVLQEVLIPDTPLRPRNRLSLCLHFLLTEETKGSSPDRPHIWSRTISTFGFLSLTRKHEAQPGLAQKMEMKRHQRFAVALNQLGKYWCLAPIAYLPNRNFCKWDPGICFSPSLMTLICTHGWESLVSIIKA